MPTEPGDALTALLELRDEMRSIQRVAGQCSVDGHEGAMGGAITLMAAAEAERAGKWADRLDTVLASLRQPIQAWSPSLLWETELRPGETYRRQRSESPFEHDQGQTLVVWYDDLVDLKQRAEKAEAEVASLRQPQPVESSSVAHCEGCGRDVDAVYVQRLCMA